MRLFLCTTVAPAILLLFTLAVDAGVKNIEQTRPRYGQRGTTVDVTISGVTIDNPRAVIFYKPGIRAFDFAKPEQQPSRRGFAHGGYLDSAITCKFEIAADCPPGEYPFRLLTNTQLSHIGTFFVSPFPTISEPSEPNDSPDQANEVTSNITINGTLGHDLRDYYRVAVEAGQQLSIELDSVRIADQHYGDSEYDLAVRLLDAEGHELATNDDNPLHIQDPILSTIIQNSGYVFVVVERSVSQATQSPYALHIGRNRRPLVAFPPGGMVGTKQTFRMLGDPRGEFDVTVGLPDNEGPFEYFGDAPSAVRLRAGRFPNVIEAKSTDSTTAPITEVPSEDGSDGRTRDINTNGVLPIRVALNGIIDRHDDIDTFRLKVRKGEPLHVRVFSAALGSPIDPRLRIRFEEGDVEIDADDASLTDRDVFGTSYRAGGGRAEILDPSVVWTPKHDGAYLLEISDGSGMGGPTGVYRVEIEPLRTVVQTALWSKTFDWTESTRVTGLAVPQGGRHTVNVTFPTGQWQTIGCEFDLVAEGLPDGVRLLAPRLKPGVSFWPVQFEADVDARVGGALITLMAKPVDSTIAVESRSQENIPFLNHSGGDALNYVKVDRYILGVTDPVPFTVDIEQPRASLVRGGELAIPVRVTRRNGFDGPIEYSVRYVDGSVSSQPPTTIPPGETESILRLSAAPNSPLGEHPLAVIGRSLEGEIQRSLGAGDLLASSHIVRFTTAEPYVELASQPESIRRGERKKFVWTVRHKTPFMGEAQVRLLGLPKGVNIVGNATILTRESNKISFDLEATDEALLGQITGLGCEVLVNVDGQEVTQRTGNGSLRIDPPQVDANDRSQDR
ncbi:MAG: hypothetical protein R3C01_02275 [Planctomycetaceae bacterium]